MSSIYCFRFIHPLKDKVTNTFAIEGSICEAYLVEETSTFTSYYYPPNVPCRRNIVPQNDNGVPHPSSSSLHILNPTL